MSLPDDAADLCQRAVDDGGLAVVLMMDADGRWKFACPHLPVKDMRTLLLAAAAAYADAMKPRVVN